MSQTAAEKKAAAKAAKAAAAQTAGADAQAQLQTTTTAATGETVDADTGEVLKGITSLAPTETHSVPAIEAAPEAIEMLRNRLQSFGAKEDGKLMAIDAEYLDLELGKTYNAMFTGRTIQIPNKIERARPGGNLDATLPAACLFCDDGTRLRPYINSDAMVMNRIAQWSSMGKFDNGGVVVCRMKVAEQKAGEPGRQYKSIIFLVDEI